MNLEEAVELLKDVSAISIKDSGKHPEIRIFHNLGEGYMLHVKTELINAEYRNRLNLIAESRKLAIRESEGYLIIYGH